MAANPYTPENNPYVTQPQPAAAQPAPSPQAPQQQAAAPKTAQQQSQSPFGAAASQPAPYMQARYGMSSQATGARQYYDAGAARGTGVTGRGPQLLNYMRNRDQGQQQLTYNALVRGNLQKGDAGYSGTLDSALLGGSKYNVDKNYGWDEASIGAARGNIGKRLGAAYWDGSNISDEEKASQINTMAGSGVQTDLISALGAGDSGKLLSYFKGANALGGENNPYTVAKDLAAEDVRAAGEQGKTDVAKDRVAESEAEYERLMGEAGQYAPYGEAGSNLAAAKAALPKAESAFREAYARMMAGNTPKNYREIEAAYKKAKADVQSATAALQGFDKRVTKGNGSGGTPLEKLKATNPELYAKATAAAKSKKEGNPKMQKLRKEYEAAMARRGRGMNPMKDHAAIKAYEKAMSASREDPAAIAAEAAAYIQQQAQSNRDNASKYRDYLTGPGAANTGEQATDASAAPANASAKMQGLNRLLSQFGRKR